MTAIAKSPKRTIAKPQLHLRRAEWFATSVRLPQMNAEVFTGLNFTWPYSRLIGLVIFAQRQEDEMAPASGVGSSIPALRVKVH